MANRRRYFSPSPTPTWILISPDPGWHARQRGRRCSERHDYNTDNPTTKTAATHVRKQNQFHQSKAGTSNRQRPVFK